MNRMTRMMRAALLATVVIAGQTLTAGNTNSPAAPTCGASAMFTLADIYNRIDNPNYSLTGKPRSGPFVEPSAGPGGTMHTLNEIMGLVTNRAPVPKTGQTAAYYTGDDGDLQNGQSWPNPRFTDNGDGTITDNLTKLVWLKDADALSQMNCADAIHACATIVSNGVYGLSDGSVAGDWRLPNLRELYSLFRPASHNPAVPNTAGTGQWVQGDPFTDVKPLQYWSSTTYSGAPGNAYAWYAFYGGVVTAHKTATVYYVWPVRNAR